MVIWEISSTKNKTKQTTVREPSGLEEISSMCLILQRGAKGGRKLFQLNFKIRMHKI